MDVEERVRQEDREGRGVAQSGRYHQCCVLPTSLAVDISSSLQQQTHRRTTIAAMMALRSMTHIQEFTKYIGD